MIISPDSRFCFSDGRLKTHTKVRKKSTSRDLAATAMKHRLPWLAPLALFCGCLAILEQFVERTIEITYLEFYIT